MHFNPRPPCGGRHHRRIPLPQAGQFQSTPPVWGATLSREAAEKALGISIHAPRVGGDGYTWAGLASAVISIHAPRVGGDGTCWICFPASTAFQSTPPVWGATLLAEGQEDILRHFNPRPPCGGRLRCSLSPWRWTPFQSTPPVWGATPWYCEKPRRDHHFNPRPPCGGRPTGRIFIAMNRVFQSTPPVWGATMKPIVKFAKLRISIHAPRVGGDSVVLRKTPA